MRASLFSLLSSPLSLLSSLFSIPPLHNSNYYPNRHTKRDRMSNTQHTAVFLRASRVGVFPWPARGSAMPSPRSRPRPRSRGRGRSKTPTQSRGRSPSPAAGLRFCSTPLSATSEEEPKSESESEAEVRETVRLRSRASVHQIEKARPVPKRRSRRSAVAGPNRGGRPSWASGSKSEDRGHRKPRIKFLSNAEDKFKRGHPEARVNICI